MKNTKVKKVLNTTPSSAEFEIPPYKIPHIRFPAQRAGKNCFAGFRKSSIFAELNKDV